MTLRETKASYSLNKGTLTRFTNQLEVREEIFIAIKSPASATQLKLLAKCDFLYRAAHQLALEDENNTQAWKTAQDHLQPLQDQIERYGDAQVHPPLQHHHQKLEELSDTKEKVSHGNLFANRELGGTAHPAARKKMATRRWPL